MLAFSKEASAADELVGRSILYNWPVVGWCVGTIKARNTDGRITKTPVATPEAAQMHAQSGQCGFLRRFLSVCACVYACSACSGLANGSFGG